MGKALKGASEALKSNGEALKGVEWRFAEGQCKGF